MEIGGVVLEGLIGSGTVVLEILWMVLIFGGAVWLLYRSLWKKKGMLFWMLWRKLWV